MVPLSLDKYTWSGDHESKKKRHLTFWAETLELKVLGDLDNNLCR
jgi:hypothetical protein